MNKNLNLFRQEHYVAPAVSVRVIGVTRTLCLTSPTFGGPNKAGSDIDIEESYDF